MNGRTLQEWLAWQQTLHPRSIDLGLERVRAVASRMDPGPVAPRVITVAGTNGKGSCVAMLEAVLRASGRRTGAYTSPHLVRYNERVRICGREATDRDLAGAFEAVERARGEVSLSYFEFGTLAALWLFRQARVDVAILEVGLGGRLDAVNIVEPDVAVVTSIGLDHMDWLGPDRESIGAEKAGILRRGVPLVCGDPDPPRSLLARAARLHCGVWRAGRDFRAEPAGAGWRWIGPAGTLEDLPAPGLPGRVQLDNAAVVLMALQLLPAVSPPDLAQAGRGLASARLPGRLQWLDLGVPVVVDIAHNLPAVEVLARELAARPVTGDTRVVFSVLQDKDAAAMVQAMGPVADAWYLSEAPSDRSLPLADLTALVSGIVGALPVSGAPDVHQALARACADAGEGDRVVVFGSAYSVGAVLGRIARHGGTG